MSQDLEGEVIKLGWSGSDKKKGYDFSLLPTHNNGETQLTNEETQLTNEEIEALGPMTNDNIEAFGPKPTSLRRQTAVSFDINDPNALNKFLGNNGGRSKRRRSNRRLSKRRRSNRRHSKRRHGNRRHSKRRM